MHQYTGNEKEHVLKNLEQGQLMTIVITGATENCVLEFQHMSDSTWHVMPNFDGTHADGVVVQEVRCISGRMRVNFADSPDAYSLSLTWAATPSF